MQDLIKEPALIPASDDKGHNVSLSTRVPSTWVREIDTLIKERDLPYLNKSDFVRDAVFKHLRFCEDWGEQEHSCTYYRIVSLVKLHTEDHTREEFEKMVGILDRNVKVFLDDGNSEQAGRCVKGVVYALRGMPDGYWKNKYLGMLEEKYAGLINGGSGVKFKA